MRRLLYTTLVFIALASTAQAAKLEETFDKTWDVRPGSEFVLSNTNGRVNVKAWDQPQVRVLAVKKVRAGKETIARDAMKELKIEAGMKGNSLVVETKYPERDGGGIFDWLFGEDVDMSVSYEVSVPRTMNLDVETVNGGIAVAEVSGKIEAETTNGRIEVARCSGSVDASTTNGGIKAELLQVTPGRNMSFETTNGRITLVVPKTFAADLDASTTNGAISTDLPVATTRSASNSLRGKMNGGGVAVRMRTTNGGIEIKAN